MECLSSNRTQEALCLFNRLCQLAPEDAEAAFTLAKMYGQLGLLDRAEECARNALAARPGFGAAHLLVGMSLFGRGRCEDAMPSFEKAAELMPDNAKVFNNYGNALAAIGETSRAIDKYQQAVTLNPEFAEAYNNLGAALLAERRYDEAANCFEKAIEYKAAFPEAYNNLANAEKNKGNVFRAIEYYKKALQIHPAYGRAHSNLLVAMNYATYYPPARVFEEHLRWGRLHGKVQRTSETPIDDRDPDRPLRIGYVSGDFLTPFACCLLEPLLSSHEPRTSPVTFYSSLAASGTTTARLQRIALEWRHVCGISDAEVVDRIRSDRIDVLVDLAGHTGRSRMEMFASKPAPVQITYLGYPNTTGLSAMDYRLTDAWADPPGETERYHTEELLRLGGGFLCYRPPEDAPEVAINPYGRNGYVTFGSFDEAAKVTLDAVNTWARLLSAVPQSKLLLRNTSFADSGTRERYLSLFRQRGVDRDRLELIETRAPHKESLDMYGKVDIALDPYPYNGIATTCEALWMGVPVVTLAGHAHAGRIGVSLLSQINRGAWIAENEERYIEIAKALANVVREGRFDRSALRQHIAASVLCDEKAYGREIQQIYRETWKRHCSSREPT